MSGVSGEISSRFGPEAIYGAGATFQSLAICYCYFFVQESKKVQDSKSIEGSNNSEVLFDNEISKELEEKASCCSIFR